MGGIVDFEVCLPSGRASVHEMAAASGLPVADILAITHCEEFPVLGDDETAWELSVDAARTVLQRTGVDPRAIGKVIYAGSGEWDIPFWSPAAKVAHQLGTTEAHCFEVTNFCNAAALALRVAMDELTLGRSEHVLVLVGDRLSQLVDYTDPDSKILYNFGDAPAAVLLSASGAAFEILHSAMRTDPSWADYYQGEHDEYVVHMRRRGRRQGLGDAYLANYPALIDQSLTALGRGREDIAYLLLNQGDKGMHERLMEELGLPLERTVLNYHRLGHMGGADTLIALGGLLEEKRLSAGDLVLLGSSGMGFSWGVTALEYRG
ncbi:3-oxoacyl-ACP synthase III family protein [Kitasatospora sp. NPDC053057]|uniref:3-oxoacyl-ACP synthase III family protein n=1 Tax=Kitasatospora sp. NPDC053057 TaxID=3364062 RepID=UPI0037CA0F47